VSILEMGGGRPEGYWEPVVANSDALWWLSPKQRRKRGVVVDGAMIDLERGGLGAYSPREWGKVSSRHPWTFDCPNLDL